MGRIGFWQLLLDDKMSAWEAEKINEAHDAADIAADHAAHAMAANRTTWNRVDQMSREIVMLRTALTVLVQTLKDTNVVDQRLLDARLEAAMEEAFPPPPNQSSHTPQGPLAVVCLKCRQKVLAATTTMTAEGPMCDRCPAPRL